MKKRLSDIGEFGFIENIAKNIRTGPSVLKGIGDDCAVLRHKKNKFLLFTTDMIADGIHFNKPSDPALLIGHKALAVNISDIAACGGIPKWAVVSAGIPKHISIDFISDVYKGIRDLARKFKIDLVGGDTNVSNRLVLSIALLGEVSKKELVMRSGACEQDAIVITGPVYEKPDHLGFTPKLKESQYIVKELMPTAMIDISDGFLSDLTHILKNSRKGAIIYESLIPVKGKRRPFMNRILNTGEQFQLLFTMPKNMLKALPKTFYVIGEISGNSPCIIFVGNSGKRRKIQAKGYAHF
jgi:thiamine-monophosphate kinase